MSGYAPLDTLKAVGTDIWLIDGPEIRFYGLPFSTRATVVRLENGDLWVHSPTRMTEPLRAELNALGPVTHLVAPNWIHYAYVIEWKGAFPAVQTWAAPGVAERARKHGMDISFDHDLGPQAESPWTGQLDQMIVEGSKVHREAVFFHLKSKTLILTDLIENFERHKVPWWMRPVLPLVGIRDPDGKMPRDMRATFAGHHDQLRAAVEQMLAWHPERVILAHGRWYDHDAEAELRRAFRFVL